MISLTILMAFCEKNESVLETIEKINIKKLNIKNVKC